MADMLLNGREPVDWELTSLAQGHAHLLERDTQQLAGLLPEEPVHRPEPDGRPVRDAFLELP
jgi:hypothetical protein